MVLKSTRFIDETIKKLGLDISYYIEGRLKTGEVYKGTPFDITGKLIDPSLYEVPISLKILNKNRFRWDINTENYTKGGESDFGDPVITPKFSFLVMPDSSVISKNPKIGEVSYQFKFHNHQNLIKKYKALLKIEPVQEASVITISIEDEVTEKAIDFLNTMVEIYIENSISLNKKVNDNTLQFIDGQLNEVESQLNGVESNLEQFQREKNHFQFRK
ncbi:MAG: hypothetical protein IPK10_04530 [Bacteroidetes bacterium]|nr:hypothetical protein [Bacteroidota bacterium]